MKKILIILLITVSTISLKAQEHLTFKGVPIDGTLDTYVDNMQKAGFSFIGKQEGIALLTGDFAGHRNCTVAVITLESMDIVNKITVLFDTYQDWANMHDNYSILKDLLSTKYGKHQNCVEKFEGYIQPRDDNSRMHELSMDRCKYITTWETDKGFIELQITKGQYSGGMVSLSYWDKINTMSIKEKALEDL